MENEKLEFARISIKKGAEFQNDPLIEFVILWIGLNALYDDDNGHEREKFCRYILANTDLVKSLLKKKTAELTKIIEFIGETHQHVRLNEFIRTRRAFLDPGSDGGVEHFGQFIYKIRNNMFHSEKPWNQKDEAKLLGMINPIVRDLLWAGVKSALNAERKCLGLP